MRNAIGTIPIDQLIEYESLNTPCRFARCYSCGEYPLRWVKYKANWQLTDMRGVKHTCDEYLDKHS